MIAAQSSDPFSARRCGSGAGWDCAVALRRSRRAWCCSLPSPSPWRLLPGADAVVCDPCRTAEAGFHSDAQRPLPIREGPRSLSMVSEGDLKPHEVALTRPSTRVREGPSLLLVAYGSFSFAFLRGSQGEPSLSFLLRRAQSVRETVRETRTSARNRSPAWALSSCQKTFRV